jgi:cytochrome c5
LSECDRVELQTRAEADGLDALMREAVVAFGALPAKGGRRFRV